MSEKYKFKGYSDNKIMLIKSLTSFSDRMSVLCLLVLGDQVRKMRIEDRWLANRLSMTSSQSRELTLPCLRLKPYLFLPSYLIEFTSQSFEQELLFSAYLSQSPASCLSNHTYLTHRVHITSPASCWSRYQNLSHRQFSMGAVVLSSGPMWSGVLVAAVEGPGVRLDIPIIGMSYCFSKSISSLCGTSLLPCWSNLRNEKQATL